MAQVNEINSRSVEVGYDQIKIAAREFNNGKVTPEELQRRIERSAVLVRRDVTGVLLEHYSPPYNPTDLGEVASKYRVDKEDGELRNSVQNAFTAANKQLASPLNQDTVSSIGVGIAYWYAKSHLARVLGSEFGEAKVKEVIDWVSFKVLSWSNGVLQKGEEQRIVDSCRAVIQRAGDALRRSIPEIVRTIPNSEMVTEALTKAADKCDQPKTWVGIATPYLIRSTHPDYPSSLEPDLVDAWILARLIRHISNELWQWDLMADVHIPSQGNNLFQLTSSAHAFPSPIGRRNGGISVAKNHLSGGAAIAVEAPVFNAHPTESSNTHHKIEGEPGGNIAIPVLLSRGYGLVYCAVRRQGNQDVSVTDSEVQAVVLGLADQVRQVLGGSNQERSWIANLQTLSTYCDLKNDLKARVDLFSDDQRDFSYSRERDVYHVVIAVPSSESGVCTPIVRELARRRALIKAYKLGSKVYELSQPGCYVFAKYGMMEGDWLEYRDQNDWPIEIYQAEDVTPPISAGIIAEYKLTFQHRDMINESRSWRTEGKDSASASLEITDNILDGLSNVARHVLLFNRLRRLSREGNYHGALAIVTALYELLGQGCRCSIVLHDVSRFSLHCGFFKRASEFAERRMAIAPWELTAHSNLLLAQAAGRRIDLSIHHIERCSHCQYHQQEVLFGKAPDFNPLLTASLSICLMSQDQPPMHRDMLERRFAAAITQLAGHRETERRHVCMNILDAFAIKDFSVEKQQKLADDSWMLSNISESRYWREIDMLRRIVLASLGAYRSSKPHSN